MKQQSSAAALVSRHEDVRHLSYLAPNEILMMMAVTTSTPQSRQNASFHVFSLIRNLLLISANVRQHETPTVHVGPQWRSSA